MRIHRIISVKKYNVLSHQQFFLTLILVIKLLFTVSCAQKNTVVSSLLDNAEYHYRLGIKQLENGDIELSHKSFKRAKDLKHDFPLANVGLALVSIANSEFKSANNFIVLAKRQDRRCVQAYIAEGRLIVKRGLKLNLAPDLWIDDSLKSFHQALEINNENSEALYYMGNAYLSSGNLEDSQNTFKIILNSNDQHWTKRARKRLKFVQEIVRLAPGSLMGKQIGFKETVTRAEMAVLLVEELKITEILPRTKVSSVINNKIMSAEHQNYSIDSQHWASGWVDMILELGVPGLGLFPDGNFYHEDRLTRVQCSLIISFLMEHLSANKVGFQKYIGTKSTFPDLKSNHYAYAAASLAVDLGLLQLEDIRTGNFDPFGTISGIEALNIIRRLQDSFRMEF